MEITIQKAISKDISKLDKLNPIGYHNWESEFFDSRKQPSFVYVAVLDNEFTGVEGYISYKLIKTGVQHESHRSERTIVLPSMRGKGVFNNLVESCHNESLKSNSICCWGATSALKPFEKAGFQTFSNWRSYYFIPIGIDFRKWSPAHLIKSIRLIYQFYKKRNFQDFLKLGITFSDMLLVHLKKSKWQASKIQLSEFCNSYISLIHKTQKTFNDYAIDSSEDFLYWLNERGISLEFIAVKNEMDEVVAVFIIRRTEFAFMIEDWVCDTNTSFNNAMKALRILLKTFENKNVNKLNTLILTLNSKNEYHKWARESLSRWRIKSPNVGSFVIKNGIKNIDIKDLRINPIWLEL